MAAADPCNQLEQAAACRSGQQPVWSSSTGGTGGGWFSDRGGGGAGGPVPIAAVTSHLPQRRVM